jgi:hypothetical protein
MSRKEICPDPMLMRSMVYFFLRDELQKKSHSLELYFANGYETEWSLDSDKWINCRAFELEQFDLN